MGHIEPYWGPVTEAEHQMATKVFDRLMLTPEFRTAMLALSEPGSAGTDREGD